MTEEELRNTTIPVRTFEDSLLRTMVLECDRRRAVLRGLTDSRPNEPWRICSPDELKAGRLAMLHRVAKDGGIRISFGRATTAEDIAGFTEALRRIIRN